MTPEDFLAFGLQLTINRTSARIATFPHRLARVIAGSAAFPEHALAGPARIGLSAASKLLERATTAESAPLLSAAVDQGNVSGEHIDALSRALRSVEPEVCDELLARADALVDVAVESTADEFARR